MNTLLVKGCWNIAKGRAKQRLARLTDDSIEFGEGKRDELTGKIQKRKALGFRGPEARDGCTACHRQK